MLVLVAATAVDIGAQSSSEVCPLAFLCVEQTEVGVLQRALEGLQQRLEEAERDKRQASELHSSSSSKVCRSVLTIYFSWFSSPQLFN